MPRLGRGKTQAANPQHKETQRLEIYLGVVDMQPPVQPRCSPDHPERKNTSATFDWVFGDVP
jgi:hypothetical protein